MTRPVDAERVDKQGDDLVEQFQVGKVQWSKLGISIYSSRGSFIARLEQDWERVLFNACVAEALKMISAQQQRITELQHARETGLLNIDGRPMTSSQLVDSQGNVVATVDVSRAPDDTDAQHAPALHAAIRPVD